MKYDADAMDDMSSPMALESGAASPTGAGESPKKKKKKKKTGAVSPSGIGAEAGGEGGVGADGETPKKKKKKKKVPKDSSVSPGLDEMEMAA